MNLIDPLWHWCWTTIRVLKQPLTLPFLCHELATSYQIDSNKVSNSKTAFTQCRHILKTARNVADRPPIHSKTAHFLPTDFENCRFWKWSFERHIFECSIVWMLEIDENRAFFDDFKTSFIDSLVVGAFFWHQIIGENVLSFQLWSFLLFSNCSSFVWALARNLQLSHVSLFSKCACIIWTQSNFKPDLWNCVKKKKLKVQLLHSFRIKRPQLFWDTLYEKWNKWV